MIDNETRRQGRGAKTRLYQTAIATLLGPKYPELAERCSPAPKPATILLVDDNDVTRLITKWSLGSFGFVIQSARNAEEGLRVFNPEIHDLVVTDNSMRGMTGGEMARLIKGKSPATPIVMYTGSPPENQAGLDVVMQRAAHPVALKEAVYRLLAARRPALQEASAGSGASGQP